ncbi:MAG TPA: MFS transporter [Actinomycetota bacterium]|jgi:MFS family permease|nr:MFS transporter [Actinomycetota bacterium]
MTPLGRLRRAAIDVEPLRHVDFRRLWLGNSLGMVGFQLTAVAVPVQVFELTGSSFWVGMLGLVGLVPLVAFGLWGGAVADAVDRRLLLLGSSLLLWACTGGLLAASLLGLASLPLLLGLVAVQAAGFAVASSTRGAIVPRVLPEPLVAAANTLSFTAANVAMVAGPLLAGLILARWSFATAYAADLAVFTVALYAALRLPALPPTGQTTTPGLRSVVDGLAFIATRPVLLLSFAVDIAAMVLAMPRALFPETAADLGGRGAVGWLYAAVAIGAVLAGLSSGWIGRVRRQGVALVVAVMAWGLAVAAAGLARSLWPMVALLAVAGAADLVSAVYRQTILQTYAPDEMRGRMQGVFIVVVAGGPRLGDLRAGATAAAFGVTVSWVGGALAATVLVGLALLAPALRNYDARAPRPDVEEVAR